MLICVIALHAAAACMAAIWSKASLLGQGWLWFPKIEEKYWTNSFPLSSTIENPIMNRGNMVLDSYIWGFNSGLAASAEDGSENQWFLCMVTWSVELNILHWVGYSLHKYVACGWLVRSLSVKIVADKTMFPVVVSWHWWRMPKKFGSQENMWVMDIQMEGKATFSRS